MTIARMIEGRQGSVIGCETSATVAEAVEILAEKRIGALPVFENGRIAGIFSERDVVRLLGARGPAVLDSPVSAVMTADPVTVEPSTAVMAALGLMTQRRFRHLPVVADGEMVAFISIGDLVKYRIERIESEAEAMRSYIQSA